MKIVFIFLFLLSFDIRAEVETGVIFLRLDTEEEIEPRIREIIKLVKKGRYRGPHYKCSGMGRGRVYAVDVPGHRSRLNRDGNIESFYLAHIKYRCR